MCGAPTPNELTDATRTKYGVPASSAGSSYSNHSFATPLRRRAERNSEASSVYDATVATASSNAASVDHSTVNDVTSRERSSGQCTNVQ